MSARSLLRLGSLALLLGAVGCAHTRDNTGAALAKETETLVEQARVRLAARDTSGALRLLEDAAARTTRPPGRDLVHGHIEALAAQADALDRLATLRATTGDTAGARSALERLLFSAPYAALADSLGSSPGYAALAGLHGADTWRARLAALRRTWRDSAFATPYRDSLPVEERLAGVALVWAEARYGFAGFGMQGTAAWDSVFLATQARVLRPLDTWEYYQELERMMFALRDDHTDLQLPEPLRRHRAGVPLDARRVDGRVILTRVRSPSLAALGLRAGQEVLSIDGLTPDEHVAERVPPQLGFVTPQARDANTYGWQLWLGESGSNFALHVRDPDGSEKSITVRRGGWTDAVVDSIVEARRLGDRIGYLALNSFGSPRAPALAESALAALGDLRGLVVDTRRNSGGSQDAGLLVLSEFLDRPFVQSEQYSSAYIGIWRAWGGLPPHVPMPERIVQRHPTIHRHYAVVWLIGPGTASAAEGVAAMAEQTGVATTVGEATFGSTGQPLLVPLPGGGVARVRVEEERYVDGRVYTGRGILPQVPVRVTAAGLQAGRDEVLEHALELLRQRIASAGR